MRVFELHWGLVAPDFRFWVSDRSTGEGPLRSGKAAKDSFRLFLRQWGRPPIL